MASPNFAALNRFRRIQPKQEAFDEYSQTLQNAPQEQDYAPSVWRRIAAGLAGGLTGLRDPQAGMNISEKIVRDPHNRAVTEHGRKVTGLQSLAKLEQEANEAAFDYENDMLGREETGRFHDMTNQKWEEDREQRQQEAEQRAMQQDAANEIRMRQLERQKQADALLASHRNRIAGVAESNAATNRQRADVYGRYVGKYGSKQESDRVNPLDQQRIRKLAVIETMKDPRYARVIVGPDGSYDLRKLDPALQREFEQAIRINESAVAKRKRGDYDFTGDADVTEEDLEFERRLQEEEDDNDWFR